MAARLATGDGLYPRVGLLVLKPTNLRLWLCLVGDRFDRVAARDRTPN